MAVRQHIVPGMIEIYHLQLNEIAQGILAESCPREFTARRKRYGIFSASDLKANLTPDAKPCGEGAKRQSLPIILRIKMAVLHTFASQDSLDSHSILPLSIGTRTMKKP
ncbi:uncharacterized protein P174DRAFT_440800 [Aspergillus novofumigatus IBT 16806]|uniref:Uncharacterized protein n=1 Tax=Aspergillus novofumigatus (strain IBT 16806) TaxID=1392255 RepID=A0A2I1CF01_ASPN1|nr:uncharacterized protein P174DRAFT_440800 [Aspergillus novofumigatus IBT 16806]PKX96217.1 hypothetical protein P174DRAFT_440800 [Aspergillus novofumigatus IBT 16806]